EPRFGTYTELWTEQFERAFRALEMEGDAPASYALMVEKLRDAPPYPEVREVLERLAQRYRLCLVSNADDEWLYPFGESLGLSFEVVISSESAQSYKPRGKIFHDAARALGVEPRELLYVGDSPLADVLGANHAGLPVAWVNRYGATFPKDFPPPDLEV